MLALKADKKLQIRVDDLASRHSQGLLSPEEQAEYRGYVYFDSFVAILDSMTIKEREHPEIISGSRRKRMAMGSGTKVEDVNRLIKQFEQTRKMMKMMSAQSAKGSKLRKLA